MFRFLHTNDMHGTMTPAVFAQMAELRSDVDAFFDSGDCIQAGNLSIPIHKADPVWSTFKELEITASVLGNRETHPLKWVADMKTRGAEHPILVANVSTPSGSPPYQPYFQFEASGLRIGLFGVMVPMATERMKTKAAWCYRWEQPLPVAERIAKKLRGDCDLVIALTHIGHRQDVRLAENCQDIDIILGGHSHTVLETPQVVGKTYICQGGSHNRFAGVYEWSNGKLTGGLKPLRSSTQ